jgi:hypothetical protein
MTFGGTVTAGSGSGSWTIPFAVTSVRAYAIGGGGSGWKDGDGDELGSGGGGGAVGGGTATVTPGGTIEYDVGRGGNAPGGDGGNNGQKSYVRIRGGGQICSGNGGNHGTDDRGGGSGGSANGNEYTNGGQSGTDDDASREGGGAGPCGRCGNETGGAGARVSFSSTGSASVSCQCPGGKGGGNNGGGGAGHDGGGAGDGGDGWVGWAYFYSPPTISYFNGGEQNSTTGVPSDVVRLEWASTYATSASINQGVGTVTASGNTNVNAGITSNACGTSPATKTYTLTVTGPGGSVSANATVSVRNDNTPSNSWTTSHGPFEPVTEVNVLLGTIECVDMPTRGSTSGSGNALGESSSGTFSSSRLFNNGNSVYLRTTTLPFNTDISGREGQEFGKTNTKTVSVTVGTVSFNVSITTRAPKIRETFDIPDDIDEFPYTDIDVVPDPNSFQYIESGTVLVNDIELLYTDSATEVKAAQGDIQCRIRRNGSSAYGSWTNVRQAD